MGSTPLTLVNTEGKWLSMPDKTVMDLQKVQKLLDKLAGNRIKEFIASKKAPAGEKDGLRLTIGHEKAEKKHHFVFWHNAGNWYARDVASQRPEVFLMDSTIQDDLPLNRDFFKPTPTPSPVASAVPKN